MSPASLRQLASKIEGAKAGLEFELCVKGLESDPEDGEQEPDYDSDERCLDIDQIVEFFDSGDMNSNGDIRKLREKLEEEFYEWQSEKFDERWSEADVPSMLAHYFSNEDGLEGEELEQAVASEMDDMGRAWDSVREEFEDDMRDVYTEEKWVKSAYRYMSEVETSFDITWPHWTSGSSGDLSAEEAGKSFERTVGRKVFVSTGYHDYNVKRQQPGDEFYIAEPDSSIEGDDGDGGLEFVSPPLSINEMIKDLNNVVKWCKQGNAYTNESTGLHMNISVPNYNYNNLDFIKLALLMGDDHVSESFGRLGTHYAKSALGIIMKNIQNRPESAKQLLDQMKTHLNAAASKAVHSGNTDKYTSINVKDGRVEFRSPGGDWVSDFGDGKVENTLLRFVVALDAAVDETKYKEEYAKKLYKLLAPAVGEGDDTMKYFAQYAAKMMPQAALKSFVKQAQLSRSIKRDIAKGAGGKYWWNVSTVGNRNSIEIVASDEQEAKKVAAKNWGLDVSNPMVYSSYTAKPLRPFKSEEVEDELTSASQDDGQEQQYEIYNTDTGAQITTFYSSGMGEALERTEVYLRTQELGNASHNVRLVSDGDADRASRTQQAAPQEDNWEVYDVQDGTAMFRFHAEDGVAAVERQHMSVYADDNRYRVRPIRESNWVIYYLSNGNPMRNFYAPDRAAAEAVFTNGRWDSAYFGLRPMEDAAASTTRQPRAAELPPQQSPEQAALPMWRVTLANGQTTYIQATDERQATLATYSRYGPQVDAAGGITGATREG